MASDAEQGLSLAREVDPDLLILDIMLPKLDGFEVCLILRRQSDVPILVLTGKAEENDQAVRLDLDVEDYVVKPFSMRGLLAILRAMLRCPREIVESRQNAHRFLRASDRTMDGTGHGGLP